MTPIKEDDPLTDKIFPEGKEIGKKFDEAKKTVREITKIETFPFSTKKELLFITKKKIDKQIQEPVLMLIKTDRSVEILENVKPGYMTLKIGDNAVKIILAESKICTFKHGNDTIHGWIHFEQEALSYPLDKEHDSMELERLFRGVMLNYKAFEEKGTGWDMGKIIAIGIVIFIIFIGINMLMTPKTAPEGITPEDALNTTKTIGMILFR